MSIRLNLRFVCYSFACFAVLGVGVYFLNLWQVQRQAGIILLKAREAETKGELHKAIAYYGQYLVLTPRDIDAQSQYGSLLADAGTNDLAHQAFEAVLRRDPGRSDVRRKAVKAAMAIGRNPERQIPLGNFFAQGVPRRWGTFELEGRCLATAGEYLAAGRSLEAAIEKDPTRSTAYARLIAILSKHHNDPVKDRAGWLAILPGQQQAEIKENKDWAEKAADYWTDRLVASNPKDPQSFVSRGYRRYSKQLFDGGLQDAEAALKLKPNDPQALHLAAICCLAAKQPDKSRDYAVRGVKAAPNDPRMYEILTQIDLARRQPEKRSNGCNWASTRAGHHNSGGSWELGRLPKADSTRPSKPPKGCGRKSSQGGSRNPRQRRLNRGSTLTCWRRKSSKSKVIGWKRPSGSVKSARD